MPLFEYRCSACGHESEHLVLRPDERVVCPSCESPRLERLISRPAVSSEEGRRRASRAIRAKNRSTRRDQAEAEAARIRAHDDE
ncbi:MAG: zinc ribbon domain-containing protein [Gemmatimonadetes bacterium]|nr:zinc ribbon domain-containing protein [Gemmatimonadota bacterium]